MADSIHHEGEAYEEMQKKVSVSNIVSFLSPSACPPPCDKMGDCLSYEVHEMMHKGLLLLINMQNWTVLLAVV